MSVETLMLVCPKKTTKKTPNICVVFDLQFVWRLLVTKCFYLSAHDGSFKGTRERERIPSSLFPCQLSSHTTRLLITKLVSPKYRLSGTNKQVLVTPKAQGFVESYELGLSETKT